MSMDRQHTSSLQLGLETGTLHWVNRLREALGMEPLAALPFQPGDDDSNDVLDRCFKSVPGASDRRSALQFYHTYVIIRDEGVLQALMAADLVQGVIPIGTGSWRATSPQCASQFAQLFPFTPTTSHDEESDPLAAPDRARPSLVNHLDLVKV